jgi:GDP-4-dehydro-6-deoxy-D-mannose reductase
LRIAYPSSLLIGASHAAASSNADLTLPLDLADQQSIRDCVAAARPDAVVHLAAATVVSDSFDDPERTWLANVDGTLALARTLMQMARDTALIFASSAEVYGLTFQGGAQLAETAAFAPANPYAASKAAADMALGEMGLRGLRVIRVRPTNHTGPGQSPGFVVPAFARQLALIELGRQEPALRVGALDRWRDFLDIRDVCAGYIAALGQAPDLQPGAAFNIASGIPRRIGDILDALVARTGLDIEVRTEAAKLRPTDVVTASCDPGQALAILKWTPAVTWDSTLDSVLDDWRNRVRATA